MAPIKPLNTVTLRLKSERGAELIEFALILPMLLLIMLGIIDFGFMFQRYEVLTNAAREGARIAVLPGYTTEDVHARVCAYVETGGLPLTGACPTPGNPVIDVDDVTIAVPVGTPLEGKSVTVTFTHSYMFVGPIAGLFSGTFTTTFPISSTAVMRNELASDPE